MSKASKSQDVCIMFAWLKCEFFFRLCFASMNECIKQAEARRQTSMADFSRGREWSSTSGDEEQHIMEEAYKDT